MSKQKTLMLDVIVEDRAWRRRAAFRAGGIERLCRRAGKAAAGVARRRRHGVAALALIADRRMQVLNRDFRGKNKPTNVLAFPAVDTSGPSLGDIAVAYGTAAREARRERKQIAHHVAHLVVHGVLHLLGYDHDTAAAAQVMEDLERRALARLGISDPYREGVAVR